MTHTDLVNAAYKWVLKNGSCGVALKELHAAVCNNEIPDVIGFGGADLSILVECKMSKSDFVADRQKPFRICPAIGMGTQRFYCCQDGLLQKEDLPDGWGLLWVDGKLKARCIHKNYKGNCDVRNGFEKNSKAEREIMYSALRRLQQKE
jgi:hypothetical protein